MCVTYFNLWSFMADQPMKYSSIKAPTNKILFMKWMPRQCSDVLSVPTEGLQLFHGSNIIQLQNELAIELVNVPKINNLLASENKVVDHLITRMD